MDPVQQQTDPAAQPPHSIPAESLPHTKSFPRVLPNSSNKIQPYGPEDRIADLNDDKYIGQPMQQPQQPQPHSMSPSASPIHAQAKPQQSLSPLQQQEQQVKAMGAPSAAAATTATTATAAAAAPVTAAPRAPGGKPGFAGLVQRARAAQLQEQQQPQSAVPEEQSRDGVHPTSPRVSDQAHIASTSAPQQPRTLSSIVHNAMLNPTPTQRTDGNSEQASSSRRQKLGNIFRKDSIRNALFMNSAASAFTKKHRSENLQNIDMPIASIAVTGAAVPALWLRRDDKGRRPPPVIFQMLKIAITDSEIDLGVSKQIIFRVELQYGDVKWVVRRSLFEFYKLHVILAAKRFENLPKFPGQLVYAFSMAKASMGMKAEDKITYLRQTNLARRQAIQQYLIQLLQQLNLTIAYDLYEFLEISAMSLTKDMGWKGKEAYIDTKVTNKAGTICGFPRFSRWDQNWAILRDSYLAFCPTVGSSEPTDVFIFDQTFFVQQREHHLGLNMHHIEIGNSHRVIEIRGEHNREMIEWMDYFTRMKTSSPWVISHRFGSFAPEREEAKVRYYVDGKDYFHAVSDGILAAKTEIYICDWWLSPELYLRRPPEDNEEFRLDRLLKRKAMEGVMIYVVVYKEISLALTLDSAHTKIWLQDLHPNIQVQRHPDHLNMKATQFWAHHEKICVIDCRLAFMGGLDLCFGRYDSRTHQLADYHPAGKGTVWPGQDYSNPRIKDFVNVKDYNADLIEKKLLARMPWHDVSLGVAGQPARDIARHFVQRWNFVKLEKGMKKSKARMKFLTPKGEFVSTRNESGWTGTQKVQILRSSTLWSQGVDHERSIQDAYLTSIANAEHFIYIENQFFVTLAAENGNPDIKNTIGIALVERILRAHREGKKFRVIVVMPLMPAFEADIISSEAGTLRKVMHFQYMSICRGGNSVIERLQANGVNASDYIGFFGLRSFDRIKHGKFDAIVEAIREAELTRKGGSATMEAKGAEPEQIVPASPVSDERPQKQDGDSVKSSDSVSSGEELRAKSSKQPAVPPKTKKGSLSSKYLLEPIPKGQEAARVLAIAERRKALDARKTWDDSITKRAMNPSRVQLGYVPAATETSMADAELTSLIEEETDQAEIDAQEASYRQSGSDAQVLDGMGTVTRNAVEKAKGTKEGGNLEPMHRRIARGPRIQRLRHPRHHGDDGGDNVQDASGSNEQISETPEYGYETVEEESAMDENGMPLENRKPLVEAEKIIEPTPAASGSGTTSASTLKESATAEPAEFPKADAPGPATVEQPVVDNEVDDFVTEQLYIHSKLMIIDDRVIICGSANINDRSQLGYRDSEIAIIIEDTEMVPIRMNGEPYQAGKMAHTLRSDLFKEHLGLLSHVEHDVVTEASMLPVDLNAPEKDPEEVRRELIRQANEEQQMNIEDQDQDQEHNRINPTYLGPVQHPPPSSSSPQPQHSSLRQQALQSTALGDRILPAQEDNNRDGAQMERDAESSFQTESRSVTRSGHRHHHHKFNDGLGHLEVYTPNADETRVINLWHTTSAKGAEKRAAADDPHAADKIVMDPLHDDFYESWWKRVALTNTEIFREVFRCVPDDTIETWDAYKAFVPNPKKVLTGHVAMEGATVRNVTEKLQKVTGHLVEFPTKFLCQENLLGGVVEGAVVPMEIFT